MMSWHNPIHTAKDFLIHILAITVGLLIALGLEAIVEAVQKQRYKHLIRHPHPVRTSIFLSLLCAVPPSIRRLPPARSR